MVATLREYSQVKMDFEIQVLLATYNGEKYLGEFLESLASQKDASIDLLVSDDGSTDSTLKILEQFAHQFRKFRLIEGPKQGPAENFFWLMRHADAEYLAFADQDDIWDAEHLRDSIHALREFQQLPAMVYGRVLEFGSGIRSKVWPDSKGIFNLSQICFQNYARGCTIVFNKNLLHLVNSYSPEYAVMHDWWLLLCASTYGKVVFLKEFTVRYRLHENNVIGRSRWRPMRGARTLIQGNWAPYLQILDFINFSKMVPVKVLNSEIFDCVGHLQKSKKLFLLFSPIRFRNNLLGELKIRLGFFFFSQLLFRVRND